MIKNKSLFRVGAVAGFLRYCQRMREIESELEEEFRGDPVVIPKDLEEGYKMGVSWGYYFASIGADEVLMDDFAPLDDKIDELLIKEEERANNDQESRS